MYPNVLDTKINLVITEEDEKEVLFSLFLFPEKVLELGDNPSQIHFRGRTLMALIWAQTLGLVHFANSSKGLTVSLTDSGKEDLLKRKSMAVL